MSARHGKPRRRRIAACTVAVMGMLLATGSRPVTTAGAEGMPVPEPGVCAGCKPPLSYHGGPVMGTAALTITPIYWAPSGYTFPDNYMTLVNQYITDIAAASGQRDNTYAVTAEYYQMTGSTQTSIAYNIQTGIPTTDTNTYPTTDSACTINSPYTACVTAAQLQAELTAVIAANGLTADINHLYVALFPPNVQTIEGKLRSTEGFCGVHGQFDLASGAGRVIYADEPYISAGCTSGQSPNGNLGADTQVDTLSHEILEAMTDPAVSAAGAWFDSTGNEIGDECSYNYGAPLGSTDPNNPQTTQYNQVINGHKYYTQTIFSNAAYAALGQGKGCILGAHGAAAPAGDRTVSASAPATATLDASPKELPADGSSTSTVTVTILDGNGEPVAGDHVHIDVRALAQTPGVCGTVGKSDGVTDESGHVMVTYTASKQDVACFVMAIDAESGSSDSATIYQGSSNSIEPAITDSTVPNSLTPGGPTQTFTVTASNPSKADIPDVRFDLFLSGDNNGAAGNTGLKSSDVHVSYADDATGGSFVNVPLSGETVKDGEIYAYVMPDTAADLPAGGSRTVTFQISIAAGAPTTAQTGAPLHIETDLDQFNPADGSQFNLDYVGPADVTVGGSGSSSGFPLILIIGIVVVAGALIVIGVVAVRRRSSRPQAS